MTLSPAAILLLLYSACVLALTAAEYRQDTTAQRFFKPACALGFILIALQSGALSTLYGQCILGALVLCAIGDVALLSRGSTKLFIAGMGAFGLGHAVFALAFFGPFGSVFGALVGLIGAAALITLFIKFIWTHTPKDMRLPVGIYICIIAAMLITAADYAFATRIWSVGAAAAMFALSDFFVGRDRFVIQQPWHVLAITPLYFGAQALFALSIAHSASL